VLLALLWALGARDARAESRLFVQLDYETDAELSGCPDELAFRELINRQLGYDAFRADAPHRVVTRTRASSEGIQGTIEWYDAAGDLRGERELSSDQNDCAAFTRTLGFAVAVQIQLVGQELENPPARTEPPASATGSAKKQPAPVPARPGGAEPARPSPENLERWKFLGGVGATVEFGMLPDALPKVRLFAGMRHGRLGFELGGEVSVPGRYIAADGEGFEHHVAAGSLAGCGALGIVTGCAVGKVGRLRVSGVGIDVPLSPSGVTAQVGGRWSLSPDLGRWSAALRVEALATLVTWGVSLNGREVFRSPPVVVGLGADVAALFQ
jgi:hypothetical protein